MKYYFVKTLVDKGRTRVRALSKQTHDDGTPVDTTVNVKVDRDIRSEYPTGTIYGVTSLIPKAGYLDVEDGKMYPMNVPRFISDDHRPTEEMVAAYRDFIGVMEEPETVDKDTSARSYLGRLMKNERFNPPTIKNDGFFTDKSKWYLLIRNIQNQVNTMLLGPTGTGKTELVMLACQKLGVECSVYDMGSMYDPVSGLLGVHRLQEGGISVFDYAIFTQDIQKPGVVLLDELSRAPVTTNNILFPCLDSRRSLPVEIAGGKDMRAIRVHPECCFIATANIGAEYTGTMIMDRALMNRFFAMKLSYLAQTDEVQLLVKRCDIKPDHARKISLVCSEIRTTFDKGELSHAMSTRESLMAAELIRDGWSPLEAMELSFLPLYEGTDSEGERGIVRKLIMSR